MHPRGFRGLARPPSYRLELAFLLGRMLPHLSLPVVIDRIRDKSPMVSLHVQDADGWRAIQGDFDVLAEGKRYHRTGDLICWESLPGLARDDQIILSKEVARLQPDLPLVLATNQAASTRRKSVGAITRPGRRVLWPGDSWHPKSTDEACGMPHIPEFEIEVAVLLGLWLSSQPDQGCLVEEATDKFPDMRLSWEEGGSWRQLRVELELFSDSFVKHGHEVGGCDWIICWSDTWKDCPLDVFSLNRAVAGARPSTPSHAPAGTSSAVEDELARLERFEGVTAAAAVRELLHLCRGLVESHPGYMRLRRGRREWNLYWSGKTVFGFDAGTGRVVRWEKYLKDLRVPVELRDNLMNWIEEQPGHFLRHPDQVARLRPFLEQTVDWLSGAGRNRGSIP